MTIPLPLSSIFNTVSRQVFLALAIMTLLPGIAHAQLIPVSDHEAAKDRVISLISRGADWMTTANLWLEQTRKKTDAMIEKTESIRRTTRTYEDRAIGELGRLGDSVVSQRLKEDFGISIDAPPDFGFSSICGVSKTVDEMCNDGKKWKMRYEKALDNAVVQARYTDTVLFARARSAVDSQAKFLLGPSIAASVTQAASMSDKGLIGMFAGALFRQPVDAASKAAEQSLVMEKSVKDLSTLADKAIAEEAAGKMSSGRALQLQARIGYVDAVTEVSSAEAMIKALDSYILMTAGELNDTRKTESAQRKSLRIW